MSESRLPWLETTLCTRLGRSLMLAEETEEEDDFSSSSSREMMSFIAQTCRVLFSFLFSVQDCT